ncbi:MAG: hypothetical protein ABSE63_12465 [Thermoguttaceae bacterium]|jgi:hypothetical protein
MTNKWRLTCFFSPVLVFGILLVLSKSSQADQPPHGPGTSPADRASASTKTTPGAKNETYYVVQIGEDIKVVTNTEKTSIKKKSEDDYKSDLKKYNDAKKDKKNADANSLKKPDRKDYDVKVFPKTFKTQDEAQKFADDKIKERDKGNAKKTTNTNNW